MLLSDTISTSPATLFARLAYLSMLFIFQLINTAYPCVNLRINSIIKECDFSNNSPTLVAFSLLDSRYNGEYITTRFKEVSNISAMQDNLLLLETVPINIS